MSAEIFDTGLIKCEKCGKKLTRQEMCAIIDNKPSCCSMMKEGREGMKIKKVGVLGGLGEVGSSIVKLYENLKSKKLKYTVMVKDLMFGDLVKSLDLLHVCIPYKSRALFVREMIDVLERYRPEITVIHSTVGIGTTKELSGKYPVVHSPIRGVHPNLYLGLMTFVKYVGYDEGRGLLADAVVEHFTDLGMRCKKILGSRNTEAGKLWSTSQYGINIVIQKMIHRFCDIHSLDFDVVYRQFNQTYNDGYSILDMDKYCKYVLEHVPGEIGGHCVVPNWEILANEMDEMMSVQMEKFIGMLKVEDR